jgi:NIPSNAP protein
MLEYLPTQIASAEARLRDGEWCGSGSLGQPLGAWKSVVGHLNRQFVLQSGEARGLDTKRRMRGLQPTLHSVQWLRPVKPLNLPSGTQGLYELRIYTLVPEGLDRYVPLLLDVLPARERYSPNVGIWTSVTGCADQLLHMWRYRDAQERAQLRPAIDADPKWVAFAQHILPLIRSMQSYFLMRTL